MPLLQATVWYIKPISCAGKLLREQSLELSIRTKSVTTYLVKKWLDGKDEVWRD